MKKLAVLIVFVWVAGAADKPSDTTIRMTSGDTFVPKTITIKLGTTVVWQNESPETHTVTDNADLASAKQDVSAPSGAKPFNSGTVEPGKQYSHTFTVPGTYKYFCIPHEGEGMVGTIVVTK